MLGSTSVAHAASLHLRRATFVHPEWARRGIGSRILEACEIAASEAGFRGFELGATITGERLYRARGYQAIERIEVPLTNEASLPVIRMSKKRLLGRLDS
jgi:GNAT superfamily N-acetyltransferase